MAITIRKTSSPDGLGIRKPLNKSNNKTSWKILIKNLMTF